MNPSILPLLNSMPGVWGQGLGVSLQDVDGMLDAPEVEGMGIVRIVYGLLVGVWEGL